MRGDLTTTARKWMQARRGTFRAAAMVKELQTDTPKILYTVLGKALDRGEIQRVSRGTYLYNKGWKKKRTGYTPVIRPRIIKALYVANGLISIADVQRFAGVDNSEYCRQVIYELTAAGYLERVKLGRYLVHDRDRFRRECM
jgi:predicted transcriptional regulator of viral defense system